MSIIYLYVFYLISLATLKLSVNVLIAMQKSYLKVYQAIKIISNFVTLYSRLIVKQKLDKVLKLMYNELPYYFEKINLPHYELK